MAQDSDPRAWAQVSWKSREARNAEELETICKTIDEELGKHILGSTRNLLDDLRTRCNAIPGTDSLREYVLERVDHLIETGELKKLPKTLYVHTEKEGYGLFRKSFAREFERLQILYEQPNAVEKTLRSGNEVRALELSGRIERWKEEFKKFYEEPADQGVDVRELNQELKRLSEVFENEMEGLPSS